MNRWFNHTNPVSLGAVLADDRGRYWGGVKEGSGKDMLWKEEASIPQMTAWDSASVFPRAASEQSKRSFLKFSLTSALFQGIPHIQVFKEQFMENSKMQLNI